MSEIIKDGKQKMTKLVDEIKKNFEDEISKTFAGNYFKEHGEKKTEMMEKIEHEIIEKYCSNFEQKISKFLSIVEDVKLNSLKKTLAIGGGILVGGVVIAVGAFPKTLAAAVAAGGAAFITILGYKVSIPYPRKVSLRKVIIWTRDALTALSSRETKPDFSTENLLSPHSFHLIPPEECVEKKINFELCIGQVIYPLGKLDK